VDVDHAGKSEAFQKPSAVEAAFNRALGFLVGLGLGPRYMQLLQVRGRKTGRIYSTPVNLLELGGKTYLVAPRGSHGRNHPQTRKHATEVPPADIAGRGKARVAEGVFGSLRVAGAAVLFGARRIIGGGVSRSRRGISSI
jgi:hypothetical protein